MVSLGLVRVEQQRLFKFAHRLFLPTKGAKRNAAVKRTGCALRISQRSFQKKRNGLRVIATLLHDEPKQI